MLLPFDVPQRQPCPFCDNVAKREHVSPDGRVTRCAVVDETASTFAFVGPRQIAAPHILVITRRHAGTLLDLRPDEAAAIAEHIRRLAHAVRRAFAPIGLSVFQNNGAAAGQSVGHYHMHLAPMYPGQQPSLLPRDQPVTPFEERLALAERVRRELE